MESTALKPDGALGNVFGLPHDLDITQALASRQHLRLSLTLTASTRHERPMLSDPVFLVCAIFAVLITGVSKGGFGGLALFAVPIMALSISPIQAAGILLPILIVMDWMSVWAYRKSWNKALLLKMLPAAVIGIAIGGMLADRVSEDFVRLCVGLIAIIFPVYAVLGSRLQTGGDWLTGNRPLAALSGLAAGFTSFVAHAGGPPFQAYALQQGLEKRIYVGTAVMFFFVVNAVKLVPYALLGQFDRTNLMTSAALIPLAPIGVFLGVWLVKHIDQTVFYRIIYSLIFVTGLKLIWDVVL